eukprot:6652656-Pyramimonas_sp.AAC.1
MDKSGRILRRRQHTFETFGARADFLDRRRPWRVTRAREWGSSADPGNFRGVAKVDGYGGKEKRHRHHQGATSSEE